LFQEFLLYKTCKCYGFKQNKKKSKKGAAMTMIYGATIFLSAFLLFTVQLLIGKVMLPYFGGSPSVWITSMMFYQILLLAGYIYAHVLGTRIRPSLQPILHLSLFIASIVFIHFTIPAERAAGASSSPVMTQLILMSGLVGLPFFVLSATAPLIQRWFFLATPQADQKVYLLYATSNLGSFLALLAYPFIVEPLLNVSDQILIWRVMQVSLFFMFTLCGLAVLNSKKAIAKSEHAATIESATPIKFERILLWLALAALPSSLSLGVTMTITTDIASIPLVWIIPLALYLLTFVIAFREHAPLSIKVTLPIAISVSMVFLVLELYPPASISIYGLAFALLSFFVTAYVCHRYLFELRPDTCHLTSYYIYMSLGGALGGVFNSVIAPVVFNGAYEFPLALALTLGLLSCHMDRAQIIKFWQTRNFSKLQNNFFSIEALILAAIASCLLLYFILGSKEYWIIMLVLTCVSIPLVVVQKKTFALLVTFLAICPIIFHLSNESLIHKERNYFGVIRVIDVGDLRGFMHGTTNHGTQIKSGNFHLTPITYYNPTSPIADAFRTVQDVHPSANIMVLGLGIGGLSCLTEKTSTLSYIEIDPAVVKLAENKDLFTFVSDCGPKETMIVGDGRLELAKIPDHSLDLLVMDAFSSDSIPFHLITRDAVKMYLTKMKPDSLIVYHVSNRFFNLFPELAAIARDLNLKTEARFQTAGKLPDSDYNYAPTIYVALSTSQDMLDTLNARNSDWIDISKLPMPEKAWTDDFVNVLRAFGPFKARMFGTEPTPPSSVEK
jgi:spermidine synthase